MACPSTRALCRWAGAETGFNGHSTPGVLPFKGSGFSLAPVPHFHLFEGDISGTALKCLSTPAVGQPRIEPPGDSWNILPVLTSPAWSEGNLPAQLLCLWVTRSRLKQNTFLKSNQFLLKLQLMLGSDGIPENTETPGFMTCLKCFFHG